MGRDGSFAAAAFQVPGCNAWGRGRGRYRYTLRARPAPLDHDHLPGGFECSFLEADEPAQERTLPPPAAPDREKLLAATMHGQEILGPPEM